MSEENPPEIQDNYNPLLTKAKSDLYGENIVAFLGPPNSGKTVIATLLRDAIFSHFLENHKDEYEANMIAGFEFLKNTTNIMLEGQFPSATLPNNEGEVIFKIQRKGPLGTGIQIRIKDISGEDYESLCISGDIKPADRVENILRRHKTRSMPYGPLSFIVLAKMYVIMIDCSLYKKWKYLELDYSHLLNSMLDFQKIIGGNQEKISEPIAIILTKTDCLPEEVNSSPKELIAKQMPQFDKTLNMLHSGARDYFELSIDTGRTSGNEPNELSVKVPWSYSSSEYERLLLWIVNNISR
jgi:hypothetical protein